MDNIDIENMISIRFSGNAEIACTAEIFYKSTDLSSPSEY